MTTGHCLSGCGGYALSRGLCSRCYARLQHRIRSGKATWAALVAAGQAAAATQGAQAPARERRAAS